MNTWTIPFDGTNYICWTDKQKQRKYRKMTEEEEFNYFTSTNKEKYLNELLNK